MKHTLSLNKNTLFRRLYYRGKTYGCPYFVLYVMRANTKVNRIGFTVSKKIGKAVARNRARRLIFECFRLMYPNMKTKCDVVIVAKTSITDGCLKNLFDEILWLTKKAGFYDE